MVFCGPILAVLIKVINITGLADFETLILLSVFMLGYGYGLFFLI